MTIGTDRRLVRTARVTVVRLWTSCPSCQASENHQIRHLKALSVFLSLFSFSLSFPLYQLSKLPCNGEWRKIKIQFFIYNTVVWGCIGVWFQIHLFALNLKENSLIDEITNWLITPFLMGLFQTLKFFFVIWMMVCTLLFMHYNKTNLFFV